MVVGILAAVVVNAATPRQYTATARLFVAATGGTSSTESYSGEQFSQQRTASYAHMIVTEQVAQRVVDKLKLQMSAKKLSSKVRAAIVPRTVLLDVSATDRSPEDAAAIANTLADSFIEFAGPLETPVGQNAPRRPSPWSAGPMCPPPLVRQRFAGIYSTAWSAASASASSLSACLRRFCGGLALPTI